MKSMIENWRIKHNMSDTRLYRIWASMKSRCYNKKHTAYHRYGGRGITVCGEWLTDFSAFASWALESGYTDELSIDRINNDKGYSPENCRWVPLSSAEQQLGRANARVVEYNGEKKQLCEWAKELGLNYTTIRERLKRGWSVDEAFNPGLSTNKQLHPNQPKHRPHWRHIEVNGERMYIAEAARKYGVDPTKLRKKIDRGLTPEEAIRSLQ